MLTVTVAAKLVKSAVEIELEFLGILRIASFTRHVLQISFFDFSILLTAAFIAIGILLFNCDWEHLLVGQRDVLRLTLVNSGRTRFQLGLDDNLAKASTLRPSEIGLAKELLQDRWLTRNLVML